MHHGSQSAVRLEGVPQSLAPQEGPLVLVIDDDQAVRDAIIDVLQSVGLDSVGFDSGVELIQAGIPERVGCLVLDVRMPGGSGLDLQRHLAESGCHKPIIFLTGHGDIEMSVQAMKAGAVDFLTKPVRYQTLLDAVTTGISRDMAERAEAELVKRHVANHCLLTARERQVLQAVASGRLNKQIAHELGISIATVKLHRSSVMRKMSATSVGELIRAWEALPVELRAAEVPTRSLTQAPQLKWAA